MHTRKDREQGFAVSGGPGEFEVHELDITACDDVAFSHSLNRMSGKAGFDLKPQPSLARGCFFFTCRTYYLRTHGSAALSETMNLPYCTAGISIIRYITVILFPLTMCISFELLI